MKQQNKIRPNKRPKTKNRTEHDQKVNQQEPNSNNIEDMSNDKIKYVSILGNISCKELRKQISHDFLEEIVAKFFLNLIQRPQQLSPIRIHHHLELAYFYYLDSYSLTNSFFQYDRRYQTRIFCGIILSKILPIIEELYWKGYWAQEIQFLKGSCKNLKNNQDFQKERLTDFFFSLYSPSQMVKNIDDNYKKIPISGAIIMNNSQNPIHLRKVLLVMSSDTDYWGLPKGKLNEDQDFIDCAQRELQEETNIQIKLNPDRFITLIEEKEARFFIGQWTLSEEEALNKEQGSGLEIKNKRWFSFEQLEDRRKIFDINNFCRRAMTIYKGMLENQEDMKAQQLKKKDQEKIKAKIQAQKIKNQQEAQKAQKEISQKNKVKAQSKVENKNKKKYISKEIYEKMQSNSDKITETSEKQSEIQTGKESFNKIQKKQQKHRNIQQKQTTNKGIKKVYIEKKQQKHQVPTVTVKVR